MNESMSYLIKIKKLKLEHGRMVKCPIIMKEVNNKYGIYFYLVQDNKKMIMIRFISDSDTFQNIEKIDICNKQLKPICGIKLKNNLSESEFIKMMNAMSTNKNLLQKYKAIKKIKVVKESKFPIRDIILERLPSLIMTLLIVSSIIWMKVRSVIRYKQQHDAETSVEKDINKNLFGSQTGDEPQFVIYSNLVKFIKQTIKGPFPATIVCGPPGTSKTYILKRTFHFMKLKPRKDYIIERGASLGLKELYSLLYRNRNSILVLDDFDTPLNDEDTLNFLKSITDSYTRRIISMPSQRTISQGENQSEFDVPDKFEYKGKIIMITNKYRKDLNIALISRCPTLQIDFDFKEMKHALYQMHTFLKTHITDDKIKKIVLDYIYELYQKDKNIEINFRSYINCLNARYVDPQDWKEMCKVILNYKGK